MFGAELVRNETIKGEDTGFKSVSHVKFKIHGRSQLESKISKRL